jgi:Family of unknown function (DUF5723)
MSQLTKNFLLISFFFIYNNVFSQEQLGLRLGSYAGINGVLLNPTAGVNNPLGWDVNIVSFGTFVANDYIFIRDASVSSFFRNLKTLGPAPETQITVPSQPTHFFDFFNRNHNKFFSSQLFVGLPSFQLNLENGHSFGFFMGQRSALTTRQIPIIADPYEQTSPLGFRYEVPPMVVSGMAWGEIGFNYAHNMGSEADGGLSFGINAKILRANQGFFLQSLNGTAFTRITKDSARLDALNVRGGFTNNFIDNPLANNGFGFGFDIGAQFVVATGDMDYRPYLFRLGASLMDVGLVLFTTNNEIHAVKLTEPVKLDVKDYQNVNKRQPQFDILQQFNQSVFGKPDSSYIGSNFGLGLPTALSLEGDVCFTENFFVNGLLIQRLQMSDFAVSKDNVFAVTPRFESRWLGASLPVSVLNYRQVRLGFAARLAFLTIGTDHLISFLGQKKLSGSDIYFALKMNAFSLGKLGKNVGFWGSKGSRKKAKCYRF